MIEKGTWNKCLRVASLRRVRDGQLGRGELGQPEAPRVLLLGTLEEVLVVARPEIPRVAVRGHEIVEVRGGVVERPAVGPLHVLLGDLVRLRVYVDEHLGAGREELPPDDRALLGHVDLGQLLHPPHGLDEEEVLRGVLLLEEGAEVVVADRVLEHLPAGEGPPPDPPLGHVLAGALLEDLPEVGGVRGPGVGGLGGDEEGVVLVVEAEVLDVRLGALGHADGALVHPGAEVGGLAGQALATEVGVPGNNTWS